MPSPHIDAPPELDRDPVEAIEPQVRGIFERPESFALRAIGHNKWVVALCAIVLAAAGVGYGLLRQPTYEASATLQVGQVNPNSPGFLGYVQSASSLAAAFSRAIAAEPVLASVERHIGVPAAKASTRLSSEPIPLSPAFRVIATGGSSEGAIALANATANAIVVYEGHTNNANPQAASQLAEYRNASLEKRKAETRLAQIVSENGSEEATLDAEADISAAKVRLTAIESAYVGTVASQAPRKGLVTVLAGATSASSDKKSKVGLYGFIGLIAGLVIGCVAAIGYERWRYGPVSIPRDANPA
jgi:hypothetical protein